MDCACVYVGDFDPPEFYCNAVRKARKEHKCTECGKIIKPKEIYEHTSGKWDGVINRFKTCDDCLSIKDSFFCDGFMHGGLYELLCQHITDCEGQISSEIINSLTFNSKKYVIEQIDQVWCDEGLWEEDE